MKKIKIFSLFVCLAMLVIACHNDDDERGVQMRTVLVYIAGDNSLRSFATEDLAEMTEGMQSVDDNSYNLLVYIDTGSSPKLIRLKKDKKKNVVQEVIATYEGRNSVDVSKMKEVINTAFSEYPAQSYGLVLWSHGEGWLAKSQNKTRWWGQDGGSNYMDISELKDVLRNAPHLSFLLFDACFMQSVEVVYELKEHADYIIGSPTEIPAPGAPYQKVVPAMFANNASATDIAKAYFEFYADENLYTGKLPYNWGLGDPWTAGVSVSVVNTSMLEQLDKSSSEIIPKYIKGRQAIATSGILCYDCRSSKYYYDFDGLIRSLGSETSEYEAWKAAYDAAGELMKSEYGYKLYEGTSPATAYHELFIQDNYNTNTEVILSKEYDPKVDKGNNVTRQLRLGEMAQMMGMSKDCADDYLTITGQPYDQTGVTSVKDELENRDPRLLQTIATPYAGPYTYYLEGKRSSISSFLEGGTHSSTGYAIAKFYNEKEFSDTHGVGTLDAIIFRYAEVLLIRAEAGAELGKDPELDLTVNALRKRVGFNVKLTSSPATDPKLVAKHPIIKGTNADLIREIRRERRVELFGEGLRYADLMRWGCGERLVAPKAGMMLYTDVYTPEEIAVLKTEVGTYADGSLDVYGKRVTTPAIFESPKHYLFSLPLNEMALNPKLKPNNPGWGD